MPIAGANNIDLHHLRAAIAASDCGSFRQAAETLGMRHSLLSRSIGQLEHFVGATLFTRSRGGVVPTFAGRRILRISRIILEQVDMLVMTGRSSGNGDLGRLSIGFCTSISAGNLRVSLVEFKRHAPQVDLATVERSRIRLMNALRNGTIDIAIVPGQSPLSDSMRLPIWSERIMILLPKDHPLAAQDVIHWTDLRNETVLLSQYDPGTDVEDLLISNLVAENKRPRIERHDVSRGIVKSLISMGLGVSLVMESDVGATFAGLTYREIQDGTGPSRMGFYAHWQKDNENPALQRFLALLSERYPSPPANGE
ncbi:LysR family transcriptional regulator [Bradyrhizobium sp. SSUT18]|uniref:LysR family transcriptional regulator n=1 Tax=Bradyrhizobium sp. SSUT18 TaxID=3040602 RepID=UPI00244A3252|nr:LysR family transcriptional regulator [Bradyrhizobium sp. SSUT18]MDH2398397.1 LysR family transcriptional regulator [Bradyrhizobium sp. SSUT18]